MTVDEIITTAIEGVFADVTVLRDALLDQWFGGLTDAQVAALQPQIRNMLSRPDQMAVGLGVILEPGILVTHPLRLEWWQSIDGDIQQLDADLNPSSLGFYDYAAAEWFDVPKRTGRRHVLGPYVDIHGTERYTLTLTMPVLAAGVFLGVAGADMPVARLERQVLQQVSEEAEFIVVNSEHRVVLSTKPEHLPGSLLEPPVGAKTVDAVGWSVLS